MSVRDVQRRADRFDERTGVHRTLIAAVAVQQWQVTAGRGTGRHGTGRGVHGSRCTDRRRAAAH